MMIPFSDKPNHIHVAAATLLLLTFTPNIASLAQGLDAEGAIDAIVGSPVETAEEPVASDEERILAAIENSDENAAEVRKRFSLEGVRIVFLPDLDDEGAAIREKMEAFDAGIAALREAIHGSAIFYHALDSNSVLLEDVVALEFGDDDEVTIFVAGRER